MNEDPEPSRRSSSRKRTLKEAKAVLRDWSTFDCTLRNLSDGGARLEFSDPVALPDTFALLIVSSNTLVPVERVWTRGNAVGIRFAGEEKPAPPRKF